MLKGLERGDLSMRMTWDYVHLRRALATALGIAIANIIVELIHFPHPFVIMLPVTLLPIMFPKAVTFVVAEVLVLPLISLLYALLLLHFVQGQVPMLLGATAFYLICGFINASKRWLLGTFLSLVPFSMVFYASFHNPEQAVLTGLSWMIGLPIGLAILCICHFLFWPKVVAVDVNKALHAMREHIRKVFATPSQSDGYELADVRSLQEYIDLNPKEAKNKEEEVRFFYRSRLIIKQLLRAEKQLPETYLSAQGYEVALLKKEAFGNVKRVFIGNKSFSSPIFTHFKMWLEEKRRARAFSQEISAEEFEAIASFTFCLQRFYDAMDPSKDHLSLQRKEFLGPIFAKSNLRYALRFTISLLAVMVVSLTLDLPGGLQPLITTVVLITQPNDGRALRQSWYRLLGTCIGFVFALGFSFILMHFHNFLIFTLVYSLIAFLLGFLTMRDPLRGFMHVQAIFVFTFVFDFSPTTLANMSYVMERLVGILLGFAFCSFIFLSWPLRDPWMIMRHALVSFLKKVGREVEHRIRGGMEPLNTFAEECIQVESIRADIGFYKSKSTFPTDQYEDAFRRVVSLLREGFHLFHIHLESSVAEILQAEGKRIRSYMDGLYVHRTVQDRMKSQKKAGDFLEGFRQRKKEYLRQVFDSKANMASIAQFVTFCLILESIFINLSNLHSDGFK